MSLSGQQFEELHEALISAYIDKASLEQMLWFELEKNLREIAGEGSLKDIIFKLIQTAEVEGWVEDLVRAAYCRKPGNRYLETINKKLSILTTSLNNKKLNKREMDKSDLDILNVVEIYKEILQEESIFLGKIIKELHTVIQQGKSKHSENSQLNSLNNILQELENKKNELDQQVGANLNEVITLFKMSKITPSKKAAEYLRNSIKSSRN
jgi:small-conductance mechanosensitive channel